MLGWLITILGLIFGYIGAKERIDMFFEKHYMIIMVLLCLTFIILLIVLILKVYDNKDIRQELDQCKTIKKKQASDLAQANSNIKAIHSRIKMGAEEFAEAINNYHRMWEKVKCDLERETWNNNTAVNTHGEAIADLIAKMGDIFDIALGRNFSVHIKVWENENHLRTMWRTNSHEEQERINNGIVPQRQNVEIFHITKDQDINTIKSLSQKVAVSTNVRYNSLYNEVISSNTCKIAFDLLLQIKENKYYSGSNDFEKYYKHVAAFSIYNNLSKRSYGLLVFDTNNNKFNPKLATDIGNMLARSLFPIYDLYYSQSKQGQYGCVEPDQKQGDA